LIEEVRKALEVKFEDTKAGANVNDRVYDIKVDNVNLTNATQLRKDATILNDDNIKKTGAKGVIKLSNTSVQIIIGTDVVKVKDEM
ncbi:hypothetical protein ACTPD5_20920, partial [Clostridioides difficile]